jgi:hypothetical protein
VEWELIYNQPLVGSGSTAAATIEIESGEVAIIAENPEAKPTWWKACTCVVSQKKKMPFGEIDAHVFSRRISLRKWSHFDIPGFQQPATVQIYVPHWHDLLDVSLWFRPRFFFGDLAQCVAGEDIEFGKLLTIYQGKVHKAIASDFDKSKITGISVGNFSDGEITNFLPEGLIYFPQWNLLPGAEYFLSADENGELSAVPPQFGGNTRSPAGIAISQKILSIRSHPLIRV